jgi:ribosome-associated protein
LTLLTAQGQGSYAETVDSGDVRPLTPIEHARRIAALAQEKLAADVVILDMRPACSYTDFFVVCTGQSPRQTKAIYDEVRERLKKEDGLLPRTVAGEREARWILADYLDVVLHVFTPEAREYYRLEELWGDLPSVELAVAG